MPVENRAIKEIIRPARAELTGQSCDTGIWLSYMLTLKKRKKKDKRRAVEVEVQ